mmetsp:Transcript_56029/g.122535  ORF Transcript_56029/g.122535 Transcript_56029/m.122535 type:complete len:85 (-) Transcript_56029:36-290(-)
MRVVQIFPHLQSIRTASLQDECQRTVKKKIVEETGKTTAKPPGSGSLGDTPKAKAKGKSKAKKPSSSKAAHAITSQSQKSQVGI